MAGATSPAAGICPGCLTLSPDGPARCGHCGLKRSWIEAIPRLRAALTPRTGSWQYRLIVQASWPNGETERVGEVPGELELATTSGGTIGLALPSVGAPLSIRRDDRETRMPLPGSRTLEGVTLTGRVVAARQPAQGAPAIRKYRPGPIPLNIPKPLVLGRKIADDPETIQIPDPALEPEHCLLVRQAGTSCYWIVDLGSRGGTFVNRRPILARRLVGGDLVQLGHYAWVFNEEDGFLVPVRGIPGVRLELQGIGLGQQLQELDLEIPARQFVAVLGPSGAGKSTLLRALLGAPRSFDRGRLLADGRDIAGARRWYRSLLGYVSQQPVLHLELTARQAVSISARLRSDRPLRSEELLRQVDLPQRRWDAPLGELSGGELNRVRTATELIVEPRLLLLDEPTSGLDERREARILNLLRSLSYQGCTVVLVTHNLRQLELFDRVIELEQGQVRFDGRLEEHAVGGAADSSRSSSSPAGEAMDAEATTSTKRLPPPQPVSGRRQLGPLLAREAALILSDWKRRLLLPLLVVPLLFALALHLAVPTHDLPLLGFLSVLASIWMGASLSLMAIVNERSVFEHERLLFLRLPAYLGGKTLVLWGLSALQTGGFVASLWGLRSFWDGGGMLYGPGWTALVLGLIGWAAVGLGLVISAWAGDNRQAANFVLPLVMIVQIVFSVQVAGNGQAPLHQAYGEFHVHACCGAEGCRRRPEVWLPPLGDGWLCGACREIWQQAQHEISGGTEAPDPQTLRELLTEHRTLDPQQDEYENARRPRFWAAAASSLTLSRYGDIVLRSFAYSEDDFQAFRHAPESGTRQEVFCYTTWRREALVALILFATGFPVAALGWLFWQTADRSRLRKSGRKPVTGSVSAKLAGEEGESAPRSAHRDNGIGDSPERVASRRENSEED